MPTLPLHSPTLTHPHAAHNVRAPGGYEWWHFDATSDCGQLILVADLFNGYPFHPGYVRKVRRFARRPTTTPPPLPGDYPCATFALYDGGRVLWQSVEQYPPGTLVAASDGLRLHLGQNRVESDPPGPVQLSLAHRQGTAELSYTPAFMSLVSDHPWLGRELAGADHRWVITHPPGRVHGEIGVYRKSTRSMDRIEFTGRGYVDYRYGTGPIGPGLTSWLHGRLLIEDRAWAFHIAYPQRKSTPPETHLLQISPDGAVDIPITQVEASWNAQTRWLLSYPTTLQFADQEQAQLILSHPTLLDSTPYRLRAQYRAQVGDIRSTALCDIIHPHRLHRPIIGQIIERSIRHARPRTD